MSARAGIGTILDMDRYAADGRTITCADCGGHFEFTAKERRFHRGMGFADPLRCSACLAMRRARYRPELRRPGSKPQDVPRQRTRGCARSHWEHARPTQTRALIVAATATTAVTVEVPTWAPQAMPGPGE